MTIRVFVNDEQIVRIQSRCYRTNYRLNTIKREYKVSIKLVYFTCDMAICGYSELAFSKSVKRKLTMTGTVLRVLKYISPRKGHSKRFRARMSRQFLCS